MNQRESNLVLGVIIEVLFVVSVLVAAKSPLFYWLTFPLMACTILFSYGLFIYFPIALSRDGKEDE